MHIEYQVARNQLSMALKKLRTLVKLSFQWGNPFVCFEIFLFF
jgi:hypothetical protein